MTSRCQAIRVLKKRKNGLVYLAIADLLKYYEHEKSECKTPEQEEIWLRLIDKFTSIVYEGLDHDI
jgi:hypothetical protein